MTTDKPRRKPSVQLLLSDMLAQTGCLHFVGCDTVTVSTNQIIIIIIIINTTFTRVLVCSLLFWWESQIIKSLTISGKRMVQFKIGI